MFRQARIKLTLLYSIIFLALFWSLSLGVYLWMNRCFGHEGDRNHYIRDHYQTSYFDRDDGNRESPGDVVMDELRNILITVNIILLFGIPPITWLLTGKTLSPVQQSHEREKQFLTDASH